MEIDGQKRLVNDTMARILEQTHETFARGGKACARKYGVSAKIRKSIVPDASASRARRASDAPHSKSEKLNIVDLDQDAGATADPDADPATESRLQAAGFKLPSLTKRPISTGWGRLPGD